MYNLSRESPDLNQGGVVQRGTSPPATPTSNPHKCNNSSTPPLSPPEDDMATHIKLPTFKGVGDEDMDRLWFVVASMLTAQNVNNDAIKRVQLSIAFEGRTLDWFMGYIGQHTNALIQDIKNSLKQKF